MNEDGTNTPQSNTDLNLTTETDSVNLEPSELSNENQEDKLILSDNN